MVEINPRTIDLNGKTALVTGGGRGLGRAMAVALAAAGASVAVLARSEAQLTETAAADDKIRAYRADITDASAVKAVVQAVQSELGPVEILVNNAGRTGVPGPIWEMDVDDWRKTFAVNVDGAFLCSAAVLPHMIQRRQGCIINVASSAGFTPLGYSSSYCVSKAALIRLAECISIDAKDYGITAFAIDPGSVRTEMTHYLIESEAGRTYLPWYRDYILAGNDVPPEMAAQLVVELASGRYASLAGRFISVTDDLEAMLQKSDEVREKDYYTLRLNRLTSNG